MDLLGTLIVVTVALGLTAALVVWRLRRRAAFDSTVAQRGWQHSRQGDVATIVPADDDWTLEVSRSFAAQMSPPSSHIVVSTWMSPTPRSPAGTLVIGPAPPPPLRDLAADLIGSAGATMTRWLGIDRVTQGEPLGPVSQDDARLLAFATAGYGPIGPLTAVADAMSAWCTTYRDEREQPVVSVDGSGICVRVRADVLRSLDKVDAFVTLGARCRDAIDRPPA